MEEIEKELGLTKEERDEIYFEVLERIGDNATCEEVMKDTLCLTCFKLQNKKKCYICGTEKNLTEHHLFDKEKTKVKIMLCRKHHNLVEKVKDLMNLYKDKKISYQRLKAVLKSMREMYG